MDIESQITQTREGWWVPVNDRSSQAVIDNKRLDWDPGFIDMVCQHISPGTTVIDIGAHMGDHTVAYLKSVEPGGTVIAYEPHPVTFECLSRNCTKAIRFPYALADREGDVHLHMMDHCGDLGSSFVTGAEGDYPVKLTSIDAHALPLINIRVSVIKIDAEGCEFAILKGAETLISADHPVLVIELFEDLLRRQGHSIRDIHEFLKRHNYTIETELRPGTIRTDIICV